MPRSREEQPGADPVELAVNLVNTWDVMADPPELLHSAGRLHRLLAMSGHLDLAEIARESDLKPARALRARIRRAIEAADETAAVRELNHLMVEVGAVPRLIQHGGAWRLDFVATRRRGLTESLAARLGAGLLEIIRDEGWDRMGVCAAAPCCCVFVDRSKNRSRRYCSDLCADRVAQAAYRHRRARRA